MSAFRDMFNSKINNSKLKPEVQLLKTYDESMLKITAVGGQTQLCPIKLNCSWAHPSIVSKPPSLSCKWFSKTEISLQQIEGVYGTYYQPTLNDVGSKVQIQCMPQLQGIQYQGMPISIEVGPIKIDPETQQQASDFLETKKATFFIKLKKISGKQTNVVGGEGLLKISENNLKVISRLNKNQKQLMNVDIDGKWPELTCFPMQPKEMCIAADPTSDRITIQFTNNKIRDVFILSVRLIGAQSQKVESEEIPLSSNDASSYEEKKQEETEKQISVSQNKTENQLKSQEKSSERSNVKSPQASFQNLDEKKVVSSDDLKFHEKNNGFISPPSGLPTSPTKSSTNEILIMSQLRKQIRNNQAQIHSLKKSITDRDSTIDQYKQKLNLIEQRSKNLNTNYFQLESQLKKCKASEQSANQQISYFKNESRLLKKENERLENKVKEYIQKINELEGKLEPYLSEETISYAELKNNYEYQFKMREQLTTKYNYLIQERQETQQKWSQLKESISNLEEQKNYYRKKYENLAAELPQLQTQPEKIPVHEMHQSKVRIQEDAGLVKHMQKQILGLKEQLKHMLEQNDFLRSINISTKDKKSSKTQLKLELLETKKIVNRLTQTVTEKDLAIFHLKSVNKGLSQQLQLLREEFVKKQK